jgi:hypothetical protein
MNNQLQYCKYAFGKENNQFKIPCQEKLGGIEPHSLLAGFASQIAQLSNSANSLRSNTRTLLKFQGILNCVFLCLAIKAVLELIVHDKCLTTNGCSYDPIPAIAEYFRKKNKAPFQDALEFQLMFPLIFYTLNFFCNF